MRLMEVLPSCINFPMHAEYENMDEVTYFSHAEYENMTRWHIYHVILPVADSHEITMCLEGQGLKDQSLEIFRAVFLWISLPSVSGL